MGLLKYIVILIALFSLGGCGFGPDVATQMDNARQSLNERDYRSAMVELKSILQDNPENGKARRLLGGLYLQIGNGSAAQKELLRAQRLGEDGAEMSLLLSQAFILQNEFDKALKWVLLPEGAAPEQQAEAGLLLGDIYMALGDPQKAREAYSAVANVQPSSEWALLAEIKGLIMDRDLRQAASKLISAMNQYPGSVDGWLLQGDINRSMADYAAAEASYKKALEATGTEQHTRSGFQARLGIIQASLAQSDISGAAKHINVMLTQLPNHPLPKYFDALLFFQQQDYGKAEERLVQVLKVMERHLPSQLLMGATQYALGNYGQANQHLTRVVSAVPSHQQARKMLAAVHMKLQSPQEAVKVLEPVVGDENTSAELLKMVGLAALTAGDVASSERYLNRALEQGESAVIRSELARIYLSRGEYDEAINELEKISGNEALKARMMIALAHMKKGSIDSAKAVAGGLADEYPEEAVVDALIGGIHLSQGDRGKARASYQQSLSKNKLFVPALLQLAKLAFEDGNLIEAEERFKQVLLAEHNNLSAFFGLAKIAERKNDPKQALAWIERARKDSPESIEPVMVLARYYIKDKQLTKAADIIREGVKTHPDHTLLRRMDAQIKFDQGNGAEAVDVLKQAIEKAPEDEVLVIMLASMQRKLGHDEQARQSLLKGLRTAPDGLNIEIELIDLEIANAQFGAAETRIEDLKKSGKHNAVAYALEGHMNMTMKKYSGAAGAYQQAFNLNPSYRFLSKLMQAKHKLGQRDEIDRAVAKWLSLTASNLANEDKIAGIYMQLGENNQAIKHYEAVIKRNPDYVPALNNLAWLYSLKNDPGSISIARKAYELAPRSSEVADTLGWVLVRDGQYEEGVERLRDAYRMSKDNDDIAIHLAEALLKSGSELPEAKQLLREVLRRNPQAQHRQDVQALSNQLDL